MFIEPKSLLSIPHRLHEFLNRTGFFWATDAKVWMVIKSYIINICTIHQNLLLVIIKIVLLLIVVDAIIRILFCTCHSTGVRGGAVVEALRYKP
jgi:hypothetical protein